MVSSKLIKDLRWNVLVISIAMGIVIQIGVGLFFLIGLESHFI